PRADGSCPGRMRVDEGEGGRRLFDLGQVPGVADQHEPPVYKGGGVRLAVAGGEEAVAVAPDRERRDAYPAEAAQQLRIAHVPTDDPQGGHVGLPDRDLLGREGGRVDVEPVRIVEGVLGDPARVEGEEVGDGFTGNVDPGGVDQDQAGDAPAQVPHCHL